VAGVLCGGVAIFGLSKALDWTMGISPGALLISVGTSAATGIAVGFFPARRASRLDPIDALRRE